MLEQAEAGYEQHGRGFMYVRMKVRGAPPAVAEAECGIEAASHTEQHAGLEAIAFSHVKR